MTSKGVTAMPKTEYVIEPGKQEIISTILLDAPRELVFKAYTDPKLFAKWWGPRKYKVDIQEFDSRPGGSWHVTHVGDDGARHGFAVRTHPGYAAKAAEESFEAARRFLAAHLRT